MGLPEPCAEAPLCRMTCVSALEAIDDARLCHFDLDTDGGGDGLSAIPGEASCCQRGPRTMAELFELLKRMWEQVGPRHQRRAQQLIARGIAVHSHYSGLDMPAIQLHRLAEVAACPEAILNMHCSDIDPSVQLLQASLPTPWRPECLHGRPPWSLGSALRRGAMPRQTHLSTNHTLELAGRSRTSS